jgi:cytochrome c-type biogenesis protein CcmH/NrfG
LVDGHLDDNELQEVSAHLAQCEKCRAMIGEAVAFEREEAASQRAPRRWWWGAAAAAVVVVVAASSLAPRYWRRREIRNDLQQLYAAQTDSRALAGRYTGEPYHGRHSTPRGGGESPDDIDDKELAVQAAAAQLRADAPNDSSPAALRARALAEATDKEPAVALQTISRIPENARDAATWNDIAVIALAANKQQEALAAVNRALHLQPNMPEALFTRWQILHTNEAAQQYLAVDPDSPWADEIRYNQTLQ